MNQHSIMQRKQTTTNEEKAILSGELVFSTLSASLNNGLSNFERLSTNYMPKELRKDFESS